MRFVEPEALRLLSAEMPGRQPIHVNPTPLAHHRLPALRGVFGFEGPAAAGTVMVTEGREAGFVRVTVYCQRVATQQAAPIRMEAEVREGSVQQVCGRARSSEAAVLLLVEHLFEVATIAGQRTVRVRAAA